MRRSESEIDPLPVLVENPPLVKILTKTPELLKIVIAAAELAVAITLNLSVSIALNNHHVLWSMSVLYFYVSFIYCFSSKGYAFRGFFCLSFK